MNLMVKRLSESKNRSTRHLPSHVEAPKLEVARSNLPSLFIERFSATQRERFVRGKTTIEYVYRIASKIPIDVKEPDEAGKITLRNWPLWRVYLFDEDSLILVADPNLRVLQLRSVEPIFVYAEGRGIQVVCPTREMFE